jgi:hypothetical protein
MGDGRTGEKAHAPATMRTRIHGAEVAERDVLNEFLALVHVALGQRDGSFVLEVEVEARGVRVRTAGTLHTKC